MLSTRKLLSRVPTRGGPRLKADQTIAMDSPPSSSSPIESFIKKQADYQTGWSSEWKPGTPGYEVPYKFKINTSNDLLDRDQLKDITSNSKLNYTSFVGNRFPTLETAQSYEYWKERGLSKLLPKVFPIHVPTHRRIDPLMRCYMHFLH